MKKTILTTALALAAPMASADFLAVKAGGGQWQAEYSGEVGSPSVSAEDLGLAESDNNYVYVAFEHFIPLIPNARLQHTSISSQQTGTIEREFTLQNQSYSQGQEVNTDLDLTHTDATIYYELLDNWVNLDLGLTLRKFDGYITAESDNGTETADIDQAIPMVYGVARFDLPFSGWAVSVQGNAISAGDSTVSDLMGNIRYDLTSVVDLGIELGYRQMNADLDDGVRADLELSGPYAAVNFKF